MASEKNERLVNLVIALLAAKKYLTKAQIFKAVAGYDGSAEASDRMFERDKEELRALGIQIDMKSIDPLFDDEIGYRILPDRYKFDLGALTPEEVSMLALATEVWKESALGEIASTTARRLNSLGVNADFSDLPLSPTISNVPSSLGELLEALEQRKIIEIEYLSSDDQPEKKKLAPYGLYSQKQRWYLYAFDTEKEDLRSYRLDRFVGTIKKSTKSFERKEFNLPTTYFPAVEVLLELRRDYASHLLNRAEIIDDTNEWIRAKVIFDSENQAISEILKNTPNVKVLEPITIVSAVTKSLSELAALHGK